MGRAFTAAVAIFLVLATSACSRKSPTVASAHGLAYCDGALGQFDVYTIPAAGGLYEIYVVPYRPTQPGDRISIYIVGEALDNPQMLNADSALQPNQEILAGSITGTQLQQTGLITIQPAEGQGFLKGTYANDAQICPIPMPGTSPAIQ